jgi:UTP--glucose-1-phosphate uridylyltransferase
MLPATKTVPKEMLPLVDKPVIQYIIEEAVKSGIEDILIITNRAKSAMDDYFDYYPELEERLRRSGKEKEAEEIKASADLANVFYVRQKETKGLGHAVWRAKRFVGNDPFAVLLGDDIMMAEKPVLRQLIDVAEEFEASTVGMRLVSDEAVRMYCTLKLEQERDRVMRVTDLIEKPKPEEIYSNYAILGRYVLTPKIMEILENTPAGRNGEIQLTDGLRQLCQVERMMGVDFVGRRYDTGNLEGFLEATIDFALADGTVGPWLKDFIKQKAQLL